MKEGAEAKAKELGVTLQSYAGKFDGDNDGQVAAMEQLIAAGAKGILLVPSNSKAIVPTVEEGPQGRRRRHHPRHLARSGGRRRRQLRHRQLQGGRADRPMGEGERSATRRERQDRHSRRSGQQAHRSTSPSQRLPRWVRRHDQGSEDYAESDSPQIVGSDVTAGSEEGGRTAMEKILQKTDRSTLVYAINEPAAYGGYAALKAAGKDKGVTIVAVDGGCNGVKMMKDGIIGGNSQQYPLLMAADGVQEVVDFVKSGKKPASIDSGEKLITDHPVTGVPSVTTDEATKLCWG